MYLALAFLIALAALITDWLDGYLARERNLISAWGVCFDPIADKIFIISAFASFTLSQELRFSMLAFLLIVVRELFVTGLRIVVLAKRGNLLVSERFGKIKTASQFILIEASCLFLILVRLELFDLRHAYLLGEAFWALALYTFITGIAYAKRNRQVLAQAWRSL